MREEIEKKSSSWGTQGDTALTATSLLEIFLGDLLKANESALEQKWRSEVTISIYNVEL